MVTFFRASPSPSRVTRAAKPQRRRQHKKSNDLPHPNKLPGIFGKEEEGSPYGKLEVLLVSALKSQNFFGPRETEQKGSEVLGLEVFL